MAIGRRAKLLIIEIEPKPASRPRFCGRGQVYNEPKYSAWLREFAALAKNSWEYDTLSHVSHVEILINGPSRRGDIDNHAKAILDGLVRAGVLKGDNLIVLDSISARFSHSKITDPCIIIKLFE